MNNRDAEKAVPQAPADTRATIYQPEFDLLLCCARTVPDAVRIEVLIRQKIDWNNFLELAKHHNVRLLVYKSLRSVCWEQMPADAQTAWQKLFQSLVGRNLFVAGELLRIANEFHASDIQLAGMKGAVIAQVAYGDFTLREYNDLDLLVAEADFLHAVALLDTLGYKPFLPYDTRKMFPFLRDVGEYRLTHSVFKIEVDLHWRVATKATALSPRVTDFPAGFHPVPIADSAIDSFSPQDLPLYLAAQGGWDQWCDLRRICDVAEFIRRYPVITWEQNLDVAARLGGERAMLTGLDLASRLLGAELPATVSLRIKNDQVVAQLVGRAIHILQTEGDASSAVSRYSYQLKARRGVRGKIALAFSILVDRTAEDASWIMLPRPFWWLYGVLRPLRIAAKLLHWN
jgi:hypothetical protein